ncbi:MAG: ornithine--oxo-acid transaminase, partial [Bacteroidota bacterium]
KVAMESLQVLLDEKLTENAEALGEIFRSALNKIKSPLIAEIRGKGLLNAMVIQAEDKDAAWKICLIMMEQGLLAKPTHGDKIRFAPPLVISEQEIMEAVEIIQKSLELYQQHQ